MPLQKVGFTELLTAVYSRLTTDVLTLAYTFYNKVPRNATEPYHVIGRPSGTRSLGYTTRDTEVEDNVFQVDSWVDEKVSGKGDKPTIDMQDNIVQALTGTALVVAGYAVPRFILEFNTVIPGDEEVASRIVEPENIVRHGILRFRAEMG